MKLLNENTKTACREVKFESYFGRKVAIDASMHIYQFMVPFPSPPPVSRAPASRPQMSTLQVDCACEAPVPARLCAPDLLDTTCRAGAPRRPSLVARGSNSSPARRATSPGAPDAARWRSQVVPTAPSRCTLPLAQPPAGDVQPHSPHARRRHPPCVRAWHPAHPSPEAIYPHMGIDSLHRCPLLLSSPSYVFDGKPPTLKSGELAKRCAAPAAAAPLFPLFPLDPSSPPADPPRPRSPALAPPAPQQGEARGCRRSSRRGQGGARLAPRPSLFLTSPLPLPLNWAANYQSSEFRPAPSPTLRLAQAGNAEEAEKFAKRDLKVTREHNEECKRLLRLMGARTRPAPNPAPTCTHPEPTRRPRQAHNHPTQPPAGVPIIEAPSEAEATCAELCKHGKARQPGIYTSG